MSLTEKFLCPGCLSAAAGRFKGRKNDYDLRQCSECQTISAQAGESSIEQMPDDIQTLYEHYYDRAHFEMPAAAEFSLQKVVDSFGAARQTGKILDIGYGEGGFLSIAERNGWQCYGVELSPQSLKFGTERGWTVSADPHNDGRFPDAGFDVVTMIEFIEHVPLPNDFLAMARRWLRPGGTLYLTTPNAKSLNSRWLKTKWSIFSPPEHLTIWSAGGLRLALKRHGFKIKQVRAEGLNPAEILAHSKKIKPTETVEVDRGITGTALNDAFSKNRWRRAAKQTINKGLSLSQLGDSLKIRAVKEDQ